MSLVNNLLEWTNKVFMPHGPLGLFLLSFFEAFCFPIPPDLLLITFSLLSPEKALLYALIATIGSVLGGMIGYLIGYKLGHPILEKLFKEQKIKKVHNLFQRYESWTIFIAGFTPMPYKIFTVSAGVFYVDFKKFVLMSFLSRGLRFFTEAILIMIFGKVILNILENYFNILSVVGVILLISFYISIKRYKKWKSAR